MPFGMRSSVSRYSGKVSHVHSMPCGHGVGRDVLGPLEVAHDEMALVGAGRREREAAVAHDHGGHAVVARARAERVPQHLGVHVGVAVDEAGRDDVALGVDLVGAPLADPADGGDAAPPHADVGPIARQSRTVDDVTVADHQVVLHRSAPNRRRGTNRTAGRYRGALPAPGVAGAACGAVPEHRLSAAEARRRRRRSGCAADSGSIGRPLTTWRKALPMTTSTALPSSRTRRARSWRWPRRSPCHE